MDPGETEEQAAYRETQEEAGLSATQLKVVDDFKRELNYQVGGNPKRVVYWLAELKDPNSKVTLSDEHINFKWVELDEAKQLSRFSDMQSLLTLADTFIKKKKT